MKRLIAAFAVLAVLATATNLPAEVNLEGVKCVVASKPASKTKAADYKDGKVYFCCGGCVGKFTKDSSKFAAEANRQLVATKQYKQTGCPFSGGEVNAATKMKVAGVEVAFCCEGCKGKVAAEKDKKKQLAMVFGEKAFKNAFAKPKK
ncbi:MAG: hypothetical protein AAFV88_02155 [Planctomycetota bacterium]